MQILKSQVFLICCFLFILHQLLQKVFHQPLPLADQYLDNLLVIPIMLTLLVAERRVLFKKGSMYRLSTLDTIMATIFIALAVEILFPFFSVDFTTDWLDLIFYTAGAIIFYTLINPPAKDNGDKKE